MPRAAGGFVFCAREVPYRDLLDFGGTLSALDTEQMSNVQKAIGNAREVTGEVYCQAQGGCRTVMKSKRADLGFGAVPGDLVEFVPRPRKSLVIDATEAAGFRSRDVMSPQGPRRTRRRRTGRTPSSISRQRRKKEAHCGIANDNGWGLGETLEMAVALLQREHGNDR